ncbi:hypothetical protein [Aquimarina sp. AU474]|uniref:hypothetical protein n=1 Tax=Aquimarina sp. AU474 TaxID=2108529 RepID=UPI000D690683|nr:hypothetical protein [Aquimarina sp. AU474]
MKKSTILLFVVVLGLGQVFASNDNPTKSPEQELRNRIALLLDKPEIKVEKNEVVADIQFILNGKGEIVVLSVDSEKEIIEDYIKARLNYKKVKTEVTKKGNKIFQITLKIRKPAV